MSQQPSQRVLELYEKIDAMLVEMRIPEGQRTDIQRNLLEAISAELLVRLGNKLSEEKREEIRSLNSVGEAAVDIATLVSFLKDQFDQSEVI